MGIGVRDVEKKITGNTGISSKELEMFGAWKDHDDKVKVTTLRMYPSTMEKFKQFTNSNYQFIPEYAVLDQVVLAGIQALAEGV